MGEREERDLYSLGALDGDLRCTCTCRVGVLFTLLRLRDVVGGKGGGGKEGAGMDERV